MSNDKKTLVESGLEVAGELVAFFFIGTIATLVVALIQHLWRLM